MSDFPPPAMLRPQDGAITQPDSSTYTVSTEDQSITVESDAGFQFTRPRHTRDPRNVISFSFKDISNIEKEAFEDFYIAKRGGSDAFTFTEYGSGDELTVRFQGSPQYDFIGAGPNKRWNITGITLREV